MAPRSGRRRVGMSRIDAALDAVTQMGYPKELVRAKMIDLLKEYGGDVGYPFIEADAYKVLIEAILEDEDRKREKASIKILNTGGPSTSIESKCSQTPNNAQIDGGDGNRWDDIELDNTFRSPVQRTPISPDIPGGYSAEDYFMHCPVPPSGYSDCVDEDEDEDEDEDVDEDEDEDEDEEEETNFVTPTPVSMPSTRLFEQQMESLSSGTVRRSKRRSRWDDIELDNTFRNPEQRTPVSPDIPGGYSAEDYFMYCPVPPGGYSDCVDGEEETNFVTPTPVSMPSAGLFEQRMETLSSGSVRRSNRRSRWDVRPEDM